MTTHVLGMLIPIVLFGCIAFVTAFFFYLRFRSKRELQETMRQALEKGVELSPEVLERLGERPRTPAADFRRGVILVAIGLACAGFGLALGQAQAIRPLTALAAFPFLIGLAYLGLWLFHRMNSEEE